MRVERTKGYCGDDTITIFFETVEDLKDTDSGIELTLLTGKAKQLAIKLLKVTGYKDGGICFGESAKHLKELMTEGEGE